MPSTPLRQTSLTQAKRVVVKIGTQLLACDQDASHGVDVAFVQSIARQIAALHKAGCQITLVSSGAVGAGCAAMNLKKRPTDLAAMQAVAAIGQRGLMTCWHEALSAYGIGAGQVLLTRADFDDRGRFLNIRNCVTHLHGLGCVAIINENDTVATDELRLGDNDLLAAMICNALPADALILLTVVDGLLDDKQQVIDRVDDVAGHLAQARQGAASMRGKSDWGTGGIVTKLEAARQVTDAGEVAVIAPGHAPDVLTRLMAGDKLGTVFAPAPRKLEARKRWIGLTARPAGTLAIDDGAATALTGRGKSLLATGITEITGRFDRGDVLLVRDPRGKEVARGLSNFNADDLRLILGKRSNQFAALLGRAADAEIVHRDNLVLLPPPPEASPEASPEVPPEVSPAPPEAPGSSPA